MKNLSFNKRKVAALIGCAIIFCSSCCHEDPTVDELYSPKTDNFIPTQEEQVVKTSYDLPVETPIPRQEEITKPSYDLLIETPIPRQEEVINESSNIDTLDSSSRIEPYIKKFERLPILCQKDSMFSGKDRIEYCNRNFMDNGCGPSSLTNALITAFEYDEDDIVNLVKEVLNAFASSHNPSQKMILVENVGVILKNGYILNNQEQFPILYSMFYGNNGDIVYLDQCLNWEKISSEVNISNKSLLLFGKSNLNDNWSNTVDIISNLYNKKSYDSNLIFYYVPAGTKSTYGPFKTDSGHYIAITLNVKEFYEEGTIYVLDSYERAIKDEPYGDKEEYKNPYVFAKNDSSMKDFNNNFEVTRIKPTVIKVSLNSNNQQLLKNMYEIQNEKEIKDFLIKMFNIIKIYGTSGVIVDINNELEKKVQK